MIRDTVIYWWRIVHDALRLWLDSNAFSYAGSLAFYTLFSLAPTVIIAVMVIGLVLGEDAARGEIYSQLQGAVGNDAALAVERAVSQSRIQEAGWWPSLLGFGALFAGATTVFAQMQFSLNTLWGVTAKPSGNSILIFLKNRVLSMMVVLAIGFILLVSLIFGVMLRAVLSHTEDILPVVGIMAGSAEFLVSLAMIAALFATIFKVLPDVLLRWRDVLVGAIVTAVLFALGRYAIAAYLAYTATASTYGAAGSVVLILLWVYYSSLILLFGAAFTKCHLLARGRPIVPRNSAVLVKRELLSD
ncbi:YihY/virulence factor BrkB family protein [Aidingimonas lacisalsi]|uniref:YihY/virulence factor BrkB family protein n=1 Tax=Aidingimonas lacisalsi TaxID=2604086 RepID=UPI0011D1FE3C|nr:YihY/virulence factor BrkB family protein [Aidingimonas lacisalsi]